MDAPARPRGKAAAGSWQWARTAETQRALLDAARAVFTEQGFSEASIAEVVERAGSSVGITKLRSYDQLEDALALAFEHDSKVLIEAAVVGREIECGVLGGRDGGPTRVSLAGEIVMTGHEFYDFEAKYLGEEGVTLEVPAHLRDEVRDDVQRLAVAAFEALGGEGLARVDFFLKHDGSILVNEVNTMPE